MNVVRTPDRIKAPCTKPVGSTGQRAPAEHGPMRDHRAKRFAASPPAGSKGCILVVDDDESVRETLADLLEVVGYRPRQAGDAVEALMILRRDPAIVALVTDLTMPGADGITLIRHARSVRSDLPAILLTGYAEQVACVSTIAGGNFHVLRKPVQSERLIEQLELLVAQSPDVEPRPLP